MSIQVGARCREIHPTGLTSVNSCVDPIVALLLLLVQQMQLRVFLGICLLYQNVVIMDVFKASLEADNFLDELEPIVQG